MNKEFWVKVGGNGRYLFSILSQHFIGGAEGYTQECPSGRHCCDQDSEAVLVAFWPTWQSVVGKDLEGCSWRHYPKTPVENH